MNKCEHIGQNGLHNSGHRCIRYVMKIPTFMKIILNLTKRESYRTQKVFRYDILLLQDMDLLHTSCFFVQYFVHTLLHKALTHFSLLPAWLRNLYCVGIAHNNLLLEQRYMFRKKYQFTRASKITLDKCRIFCN